MCNLYSMTRNQEAIRRLFGDRARSRRQPAAASSNLPGHAGAGRSRSERRRPYAKAMPVILTTAKEWNVWLQAPWTEAAVLQRPLPTAALRIVATGEKIDRAPGQA